jgi:hypothetical protein
MYPPPAPMVLRVVADGSARLLQESGFLWGIDGSFFIWFGFWLLDYLFCWGYPSYCCSTPCIQGYHCQRVSNCTVECIHFHLGRLILNLQWSAIRMHDDPSVITTRCSTSSSVCHA